MLWFCAVQSWFCYVERTHLCQQLPMVILHGGLIFPLAISAEIQDMLNSFYNGFDTSIYIYPIYAFACCFFIPIWLLCGWFISCFCSSLGITIHLPFSIIPPITAISSLNVLQYELISCGTSVLLSCQSSYNVCSQLL